MTFGRLCIIWGAIFLIPAGSNPALAEDAAPRFVLPALGDFWAIIERPLLSRSRRPDEDAPVQENSATVDQGAPAAEMMLVGTATDQRARAVAVLRNSGDAAEFRIWIGDTVRGWKVKSIRARALVLESDGNEVTVTLDDPILPEAPAPR